MLKKEDIIERKIDQNGRLMPGVSVEKSKFFKILEENDPREIEDWLIRNGRMKPFCPFRFINPSLEQANV